MLFNSPEFLFGFLPLTVALYYLLARYRLEAAMLWLVAASLFFYGWWNPAYLLLIAGSIGFNYGISLLMVRGTRARRKALLVTGVAGNLACLAWFKYAMFIAGNLNFLLGTQLDVGRIVLPLAISFFTFQQITFLVDTCRAEVHDFSFRHYCLFVTFFPQLIAGPIVHHREMMPQFARPTLLQGVTDNFNRGITVFAIGLFKKVVLADTMGAIADPAFALGEAGGPLSTADAWCGALAYTFQLYFDFSGYSDMAIGLAILFGIRLPLNFYSPYRAHSIIDFWRRWHMTLSRFLRDYVYIPLGGNRRGRVRRHVNLMLTMLVGGAWHGASWSFVLWGALHGLFLVINHGWRALLGRVEEGPVHRLNRALAPVLTFLCVVVAWVYFRAPTLDGAHHLLGAMLGFSQGSGDTLALSRAYLGGVASFPLQELLQPIGASAKSLAIAGMLAACALVAFCLPNPVELMGRQHPAQQDTVPETTGTGRWQPTPSWALGVALLLLAVALSASGLSPFLYFQF